MAFSKHIPLSNIKIIATDIDKQVIQHAQVGLYNAKSIVSVPDDLKKKYFTQVGSSYQIADEIKKCVEFKEHNLLKDVYPKDFDLILCRNVVIYFTDDAKDMIYAKFFESLKKKGILFIGSTEQINNYKDLGFERLSSFYFQKPE
jgi:chemotaxis protein methyltransferase CheR